MELLKNIYHELKAFYFWISYCIFNKRNEGLYIASIEETIKEVIENKKSISRFGDGEIKWVLDLPQNSFQSQNEELQADLIRVLTVPNEKCLITLPPEMRYMKENTKRSRRFWREFFVSEGKDIVQYLDKNRKYYNTDISRFYMGYMDAKKAKTRFENLKHLWKNRDVLIVEGEKTRLGMGNDLFDQCKSIRRILAPAQNAYDVYEVLLSSILKYVKQNELVLLALGPTATVLAYDLSKSGIQAVDIGHVDIEYEWCRLGTRQKVAIDGKYVNEAGDDGRSVSETTDEWYSQQIILKVDSRN